jgi:signal transduction histidine kinase
MVKVATAGASVATAVALVPLIPRALQLPSVRQWEDANQKLRAEIAERERVEAEVLRLNAELTRRVAELESKNQDLETFSHSISHDLRAPLRAMRGFADVLLVEHGDAMPPDAVTCAERIRDAGANMDQLISDLLMYSRVDRIEETLASLSLHDVVREALHRVDAVIQDRQANVTVEEPMPGVVGYHRLLVHVLSNLVANAATFVPPERRPIIVLRAVANNGMIRVMVQDNGIGIAPEHHGRIFRIFERLHGRDVFPGTGIGLALVAKGIERMGGRVGVESREGTGSTFWFEIPGGQRT